MSGNQQKDIWDKIGSLSGVFATTLVAIVGLYFTDKYEMANNIRNDALDKQNKIAAANQAKLQELEAVESLLPHLSGKEADSTRQKLTLLALRKLGNQELAIQFAEILNTEGAKKALQYTAKTTDSADERKAAEKALSRLTLTSGVGMGDSVGKTKLQKIIDIINSLKGQTDGFLILERSDQHYMQTIGGPDSFTLEYREGSGEKHYQCTVSKNVLLQAFRSYAINDDSWRRLCNWKKLTF